MNPIELADELRNNGVELLNELGRGARSVVYRARREGVPLAVKIQHSSASPEFGGGSVRFWREAAALARVNHPSVPQVLAAGEAGQQHYIILEYVDGDTLSTLLEEGPLPLRRALELSTQLVEALVAVHERNLVHRDIKPKNILVTQDGRIKLIDFGFAAGLHERAESPDFFAGTLAYCAPEQSGMLKRPVDGRSDLYSLGCVMYEAITGRPPFRAADPAELMRSHAVEPPPDVRGFRPEVQPEVASVLARCLAKDPDDRFPSARDLLKVLRGWREPSERIPLPLPLRARLVGREAELELLGRLAQEAAQGHGAAAFVLGGAGEGKSCLVRETVSPAGSLRRNTPLLMGKCVAGEAVPFAVLRSALTGYVEELRTLPPTTQEQIRERLRSAAGEALPVLAYLSPSLSQFVGAPSASLQSLQSHSQLYEVLSSFLRSFILEFRGTILCIDDLQWIDEASYQVLLRVGSRLPFLLLASVRSECQQEPFVVALREAFDAHLVRLAPLNQEQVADLIAERLGSRAVPAAVPQALAVRSGGNPFALEEYLNALLDRGYLRPAWGSWVLDGGNLDSLALPADLMALVVARTTALGPESHALLSGAALLGTRFRAKRLAWVAEVDLERVEVALSESQRASLVVHLGGDHYALVHDRVREALLEQWSSAQRAREELRLAERLRLAPELETAEIYAVAEHSMRAWSGGATSTEASLGVALAGETAMRECLFEQALRFYRWLAQAAPCENFTVLRNYGEAAVKSGDADEGIAVLERALAVCPNPLDQASLHLEISRAHLGRMDFAAAIRAVERGFRSLGLPPAKKASRAALVPIVGRVLGAVGKLYWGRSRPFVPPQGNAAERLRLEISLFYQLTFVAHFRLDPRLRTLNGLSYIPACCRLGPCRETAIACAGIAAAASIQRLFKPADKLRGLARQLAQTAQDPVAQATVDYMLAVSLHLGGRPLEGQEALVAALRGRGVWLEPKDFLTGVADGAWNFLMRGYAREGWQLLEMGLQRTALGGGRAQELQGHSYRAYAGPVLALLGRGPEGAFHLEEFEKLLRDPADDRWRWGQLIAQRVLHLLELGEVGRPLEDAIAQHCALGLQPEQVPLHLCGFYVGAAYGRLRQTAEGELPSAGALEALSWLKRVKAHPTLEAHFWTASGWLASLQGRAAEAEKDWVQAEKLAHEYDNPWVLFELCWGRSRLFARRGWVAAGARQARQALSLATDHGWVLRARRARLELGLATNEGNSSRSQDGHSRGMHLRRHLDALLQVSLASTSVLEPTEQARAILDVLLRLFGAERAFLVLQEQSGLPLRAVAARTTQGESIENLDGFSRTVVERVFREDQALTINTEREAEELGSQSILTLDLRSVMAAPVRVRERILGVVYLDSRLARGVFAVEDVDILLAIAAHIGVGVETGRIAQLQVQVREEQAQRALAESLRAVSSALNASLDLSEVLQRVLEGLQILVGYEQAEVLILTGEDLRVAASGGSQPRPLESLVHSSQCADPALQRVLASSVPLTLVQDLPLYARGEPGRIWLGVPLWVGNTSVGALALERSGERFDERTLEIVSMFADQVSLAIQNARIFAEVHAQATIDPLTQVHNRREILRLAEQELRRSQRHQRPFTLAILDVDYFKKVNDSYGHPVGDEVLLKVARLLLDTLRDVDWVGRYGGEEFLFILPETEGRNSWAACERVRAALASEPLSTAVGPLSVTASIGFWGESTAVSDLAEFIAQADAALYRAKQGGRNRVEG